MTKDHLKAVLIGRKKLLKLKEVNEVVVPFYDELSVKAWYAKMLVRPELQPFYPTLLPKGDRSIGNISGIRHMKIL